ncbi:MAG TPA: YetF domain-containing protein [Cyclobacteriaceae bacterium]|nr:YetF domain-containing protein [Cyclobacteriaceae bacterium]
MDAQEIIPWDWRRIFIGEVPGGFLLEVVLRVAFIYLLLLISMRILGKKMASQFTRNEMAALVCLASAVGVPILSPDRGLLPALIICIVIILLSRMFLYFSVRSERVEAITLGSVETLIDEGVMNIKTMESTGLSQERVFAQLRSQQIMHLGEVRRLYFEANGKFTLIKSKDDRPGLTVIPDFDTEFTKSQQKTYNVLVCSVCGQLNASTRKSLRCPSCRRRHWKVAVTSAEKVPDEVAVGHQ